MSILGIFTGRAEASPESDFWVWFQKNDSALFDFERDQETTFDRLAAELRKVHPDLTFEFGPKKGGKREFIISADGIRAAFPKVESLYAAAPSLSRWTFIKFRPRRAPFDIEYQGINVKADSVRVLLAADGARTGVTVLIPGYSAERRKTYGGIAFLLLDQALGEFDVEARVGSVDVDAPPTDFSHTVSLEELPSAFDAFAVKH